jgi:hypothetical protein
MTNDRPLTGDNPKPWFKKKRFVIPIALVVLAIIGAATSGQKSNTSSSATTSSSSPAASSNSSSSPAESQAPAANWYPVGFHQWSNDSNVAWQWVKGNFSCNADAQNGCYKATFISQTGCSYFYAAVNLLDGSGSVIDYANGTLPTLQPLQKATLEFDDIQGNSKSAQMAKITCG